MSEILQESKIHSLGLVPELPGSSEGHLPTVQEAQDAFIIEIALPPCGRN